MIEKTVVNKILEEPYADSMKGLLTYKKLTHPQVDNMLFEMATKSNNPDILKYLLDKQLELPLSRKTFLKVSEEEIDNKNKLNTVNRRNTKLNLIKEAGHILGLNGTVTVKDKNKTEQIECEGIDTLDGLNFFLNYLEAYTKQFPLQSKMHTHTFWKMIIASFQAAVKYDSKTLHDRYHQNKLVVIHTGWEGHAVMIGLYKDYLVYCNRGESLVSTTLNVYKLADKSYVTPEYIAKLNNNSTRGMSEILGFILGKNSILDSLTPIVSFPAKHQKVGNCLSANSKSLIRGLLYLLEQDLSLSLAAKDVKSTSGVDLVQLAQIQEEAREMAYNEYKKFTKFIRDRVIDKILAALDDQQNNEDDKITYVQLLEKFLSKDLNESGKKEEELCRRAKIIQFLEKRKIPFDVTIKPKIKASAQPYNGYFDWLRTLCNSSVKLSLNNDYSVTMSLASPKKVINF